MVKTKKWNNLFKSENEKKIALKVMRQGFYFSVLLAAILGLWKLSASYKTGTFAEYGLVENLQLIILTLSTFSFLGWAIKYETYRPITFSFASLTTFCAIRELDSFFERILPIVSWKFAYLFPLMAVGYAIYKRKTLAKPLFNFLSSFAFDLMFTAMIVFIPLAQCIGHKPFITDAIGSVENVFLIRRMTEESMELMAYILVFLSSIELYFGLLKKKN